MLAAGRFHALAFSPHCHSKRPELIWFKTARFSVPKFQADEISPSREFGRDGQSVSIRGCRRAGRQKQKSHLAPREDLSPRGEDGEGKEG
jgi:hypothetical protein